MHIIKSYCISALLIVVALKSSAQEKPGAIIPWTTYEAEAMHTDGTVLGPKYEPYQVETESSGQRCVKLNTKGQFVEFTALAEANSMVIRFSLPDSPNGNGTNTTLAITINGKLIRHEKITSHYAWLYGKYPFTNDPAAGVPRRFYDDIRLKDLKINKDDLIRITCDDQPADDAAYCILDLVDLENITPPLKAPANSLSITDKAFGVDSSGDYTTALKNCIAEAVFTGKTVWIPAGTFKITKTILLPSNVTIQGAGMWYTELVGDSTQYNNPFKRVGMAGNGSNIHIADFAITGKLNYRIDTEANSDGIGGSFGENSTITNLWIEHTKVGMWILNSKNLKITGCRMRNTMADGINFCTGMAYSTIENCTARNTGDDCFAIWPTVYKKQTYSPGHNLVIHCTGQLPYLANGAAVYGGDSNAVKYCSFTDISQGSAILISTTFPTESADKTINNNFSGATLIEDCDISTSGGFDHEWDWRAAIEICLDKRGISGLEFRNLNIKNSFSNAISIIAKNTDEKIGVLTNTTLQNVNVLNYSIGVTGKHGLFISNDAHGSLSIEKSGIADINNNSVNFTIQR
jgi:hypothetical protein